MKIPKEQGKAIIKRDIKCTEFLEPSKNNMYCCPYCGSGKGSHGTGAVKYYPDSNTFYCHACDKGGDVIDAYTATTGADYIKALAYLGGRAGINIELPATAAEDFNDSPRLYLYRGKGSGENKPHEKKKEKDNKQAGNNKKAPQIENNGRTEAAADYTAYYDICRSRLNDPAASSYLQARGISITTAEACGIGYDPAADPAAAPGATGNEYKAHAAPRLIIPCSRAHYVARSIDPDTPAAYKAMNPNTQKGGGRVALFNAEALGAPIVFITEGAFDALSFIEAGAAAVALNSKGNGKLLLDTLQDHDGQPAFIIVPDNDSNPDTAADTMKRAAALNSDLQGRGYKSIVYNVAGQYHDANDALQADAAAFKRGIDAAINELSRDDLTDFLEKIQTEAYKPHSTGLNFFDDLLGGGIVQQSILLLMAAPGTGKTTLAQQLAETIAEHGQPALFLNFEMSREQLLAKAISAKLYKRGIDKSMLGVLQGYRWNIDERAEIEATIDEYRRTNYPYIKYNPAGVTSELSGLLSYLMATGAAAEAAGRPAPAVVVDYLHLITSRDRLENTELIKQSIVGLKEYAVKYNTFVIAISATNRDSSKAGRITLESGRDSSNIEYTGDYVISLNYDEIDSGKVKPGDVEKIAQLQQATRRLMILRVLKNRLNIPGKSARVMYDAKHNMFYGAADEFIPAGGFMYDDGAPAFDDDSDIIKTI